MACGLLRMEVMVKNCRWIGLFKVPFSLARQPVLRCYVPIWLEHRFPWCWASLRPRSMKGRAIVFTWRWVRSQSDGSYSCDSCGNKASWTQAHFVSPNYSNKTASIYSNHPDSLTAALPRNPGRVVGPVGKPSARTVSWGNSLKIGICMSDKWMMTLYKNWIYMGFTTQNRGIFGG